MSPLLYSGQNREVYCLQLQNEPLLSLRLEFRSPTGRQPITYLSDSWSFSCSPLQSSPTMVPYTALTALPPPHCPITIPNADSLRLAHDSHCTSFSQNFPPFSCLLSPTSNITPVQNPTPQTWNSLMLGYASVLWKQCQQPWGKGSLRTFLKNSSLALT